jgi:SNF2 family DNA or RNA helicase
VPSFRTRRPGPPTGAGAGGRHHGESRHLDDLATDELVVASYGVMRRDADRLAAAGFTLVVADEAQHAKNPFSETARSLRRDSADARVALSGTPVENRLTELWSILDWSTPGLLGPLERFRRSVATPIERHSDVEATERLARTVRPFSSGDVSRTRTSPRSSAAEVKEALAEIEKHDGIQRRGLVLRLLTVLKQICNHPAQYLHQPGPIARSSG